MVYPIKVKEAVIKKVQMGGKLHHEIASEAGIGRSTLTYWLKNHKKDGNKNLTEKEKRPQDWTVEQRLNALMETGAMPEGERASWCRKRGVFSHHLEQWKKDILSLTSQNNAALKLKGTAQLKKENAALKKELNRKDKALAETAALLVLKKKADFIWGVHRDD